MLWSHFSHKGNTSSLIMRNKKWLNFYWSEVNTFLITFWYIYQMLSKVFYKQKMLSEMLGLTYYSRHTICLVHDLNVDLCHLQVNTCLKINVSHHWSINYALFTKIYSCLEKWANNKTWGRWKKCGRTIRLVGTEG